MSQASGVRGQGSGVRGQESGIRNQPAASRGVAAVLAVLALGIPALAGADGPGRRRARFRVFGRSAALVGAHACPHQWQVLARGP